MSTYSNSSCIRSEVGIDTWFFGLKFKSFDLKVHTIYYKLKWRLVCSICLMPRGQGEAFGQNDRQGVFRQPDLLNFP